MSEVLDVGVVTMREPAVAQRTWPRGTFAALVVQAASALGLLALGLAARDRLESVESRLGAQTAAAERHAALASTLAEQSKALTQEVVGLREAVASHAREESLFLKMLILKPQLDQPLARRIARSVALEAMLFGQDPNLVLAIMAVESDFNPKAVSSQGAVGLMQVMPHWKKVLGLTSELTEPEVSIHNGIQILGFYQQMYKDLDTALTAYNRGPGPVDGALIRGTSPANGYAAKVQVTFERLKALDSSSRP
jgi:soluble lytic murein transglycosylase-like protein